MGQFRDYLNENRNKSVPTEYRIALGQLKRMYNKRETPELKELEKDSEMIAKKNHLDSAKFLEFAKSEFKLEEAKLTKSEYKDKKEELINLLWKYDGGEGFDKKEDIYKQYKMEIDTIMLGKVKLERALELLGFNSKEIDKNDKHIKAIKDFLSDNLNEANHKLLDAKFQIETNQIFNKENVNTMLKIASKIEDKVDKSTLTTYLELIKRFDIKDSDKVKLIVESAVGKPGRTTIADAEEHISDDLVIEFKKIIKKLGGKTVAKVLLDKLGSKPEIKDEIDNIEDIIDNSNY